MLYVAPTRSKGGRFIKLSRLLLRRMKRTERELGCPKTPIRIGAATPAFPHEVECDPPAHSQLFLGLSFINNKKI
jgi:hypothetical protein